MAEGRDGDDVCPSLKGAAKKHVREGEDQFRRSSNVKERKGELTDARKKERERDPESERASQVKNESEREKRDRRVERERERRVF